MSSYHWCSCSSSANWQCNRNTQWPCVLCKYWSIVSSFYQWNLPMCFQSSLYGLTLILVLRCISNECLQYYCKT